MDGQICARPLSNRIVTSGLILATILVVGALAGVKENLMRWEATGDDNAAAAAELVV